MAITLNGTTGVVAPALSGDGSGITGLPAPSTSDVLTATAGASVGAVGTYAWLVSVTLDVGSAWGATVAGSSLRSAGLATENTTSITSGYVTASGRGQGTLQSGTWRSMGQSNFSGMYGSRTTLFLRIS